MENESPASDLITALGYLCLGSRLKRLGERLQLGVSTVLGELGHEVQPAQLPLLMALHREGPLTAGGLGERVGISQPGASRAIGQLETLGLVEIAAGQRDKRLRRVALSPQGAALMAGLEATLFPVVDGAVGALCRVSGPDLLDLVATVEQGLASEPLDRRIRQALQEGGHG